MLQRFIDKLRFDKQDQRFELLETESGEPKKWSGWTEKKHAAKSKRSEKRRIKLSKSVDANEKLIKSVFHAEINSDLIVRRFTLKSGMDALIVYMNGMALDSTVSEFIMRPLMNEPEAGVGKKASDMIEIGEVNREPDFDKVKQAVLDGKTALFIDGERAFTVIETRGYEKRSVSTVDNERIVKGPKEGFTENLRTNITLIRRIIRTEDLIVHYAFTGGENNTRLALVYRQNITNERLVKEIKRRLERIRTRMLVSTGIIEQLIEDETFSPIPQTLSTERPDRVASFVMQGAAAIFSDGSPIALVLPSTLASLMSSPEDAYLRRPLGTVMRSVRYAGALISVLLPGGFISLAMYHQGLLSTEVLSTVIKSREMVFEPLPLEMLLLLFVFQLIREAGMRVPGSIGQAIGVIGGLILGQAAVAANLASTVILIIVALAGLGNLCIPDYSMQISASYFRMALVIAGWLGGLLAFGSAALLFAAYLANLKSFGVPFLTPFAPKTYSKRPYVSRGRISMHRRADDYFNTEEERYE
ncbi:MAG: spore germination protein [Clostridia bacterium]|nr:spore germination protein [Clostridia bacterium]